MKDLYLHLQKYGLNNEREILEFTHNEKIDKLLEVSLEAFVITNNSSLDISDTSLFNFSGSLTMSGGDYPCESLGCRFKALTDSANFASIYSNSFTIYNPFDFSYEISEHKNELTLAEEDKIRQETFFALKVCIDYRSLIESRIMIFSKTLFLLCSEHKKKQEDTEQSLINKFTEISNKVVYPYLIENLKLKYDGRSIHLAGAKELIGDEIFMQYERFPRYMANKKGKKFTNIKELQRDNPLLVKVFDEAISSLMLQKISNLQDLTKTYLTNNRIETLYLDNLGEKAEDKVHNLFVEGVPLIDNMPYESILSIRKKYPDEFGSFQNNVSQLVSQAKKFESQGEFNEYISSNLKNDLLDLGKVQHEGIKNIASKSIFNSLTLFASISIATTTNFEVGSLLSLAQALYSCSEVIKDVKDFESKIKTSPIYFYYKLTKS